MIGASQIGLDPPFKLGNATKSKNAFRSAPRGFLTRRYLENLTPVEWTEDALRDLGKLDPQIRLRVLRKISWLSSLTSTS